MDSASEDQDLPSRDEQETFEGVGVPAKQRTVLEPPDEEEIELRPADSPGGDEPSRAEPGER